MIDSPIDQLLEELLQAHDRQRAEVPREPARPRRHPRRRVVLLPAVLLIFAASAAAAIVIATHRSAPLKGALPRQLLGSRYSLTVAPDLTAGHAGWCTSLQTFGSRTAVLEGPANCASPGAGALITRGGLVTLDPRTGTVEGWLLYAIVRRGVYALRRPDGARILPISSPSLPHAWTAAVTIQTMPKPRLGAVVTLTPISASGTAYSTVSPSPIDLSTVTVSPTDTSKGDCWVDTVGSSRLQLTGARALKGHLPRTTSVTPGYLSCFSASTTINGQASTVALLVNAADTQLRPSLLPGSLPVAGAGGIWVSPAVDPGGGQQSPPNRLFTKRAGKAWLALETAAPEAAAIAALDDLAGRA